MTGKQFLLTGGGVLYGFLLSTAAPDDLTRETKVWLWLGFAAYWIALGLYEAKQRRWRCAMTLSFIVITGAVVGAVAGLLVGLFFRAPVKEETDNPTAMVIPAGTTTMVTMSPLIPDPNLTPASPDDLELYFFALMSAAVGDNLQYADVTVTNRSPRKMHLEMWGIVNYWKDNGEPASYGLKAEWNPKNMKEGTGQTAIDLDPWETKKGRVGVFLNKRDVSDLGEWFLDPNENVYFDVFDAVTGKRIAFEPSKGYPKGQVTSPIPSHELLRPDFPVVAASEAQVGPAPQLSGLVLRTRNLRYNGTRAAVEVLVVNSSASPLEIEVNAMVRVLTADNTWLSIDGQFSGIAGESSDVRTLRIDPGDRFDANLTFDFQIIGVSSDGGWNLRTRPKDTLLEITDRISGRKVWCAMQPGYPPGTDQRGASIVTDPRAILSNPQQDESNATKSVF